MKKRVLFILAVLGVLAACTREEAPGAADVNASDAVTITVHAGTAGTRTAITEQDGGFAFTWTKGDRIAIEESCPDIAAWDPWGACETFISSALSADTDEATFTVQLDPRSGLTNNLCYTAVYPADYSIMGGSHYNAFGQQVLSINFPRNQYPLADSFDPAADVLVSQPVSLNHRPGSSESLTFNFARMGTIVKMVLNGLPETMVLRNGEVNFDFEAGYYVEYYPAERLITGTDGSLDINFSYEGPEGDKPGMTVGADRQAVVWLRCLSGESEYIYLELNDGSIRRRINLRARGEKLSFKEGGLTTFVVNFATPDVENPDDETVSYHTNASMDGVTVSWPDPGDADLAGYEAFLRDEQGTRYDFDAAPALSMDGTRWEAVISGGLEPGGYMLFVRALAVDGKVSQPDYIDCNLSIAIPLHQTITGGMLPEMGFEDYNYEFSYRNITYGYRNMYYSTGWNASPSREQTWAFWTKTPLHLGTVLVTPRNNDSADFQVYASDEPFVDGHPHESDEPLPYNLVFGNKQFQADGKAYLLIESRESIWLSMIDFDYYY